MLHFNKNTAENVNVKIEEIDGVFTLFVTDLDAGAIVGTRRYISLACAMVYAEACVAGLPMPGDYVTI